MKIITLASCLSIASIQALASNSLHVISSPNTFLGNGAPVFITPDDGYQMDALVASLNDLRFLALGHNSVYGRNGNPYAQGYDPTLVAPTDYWIFNLHFPDAASPSVGHYEIPIGPNTWSQPIVDIEWNYFGASKYSGSVDVLDLQFTSSGAISSLKVDFNLFVNDNPTQQTIGYINYSLATTIPEPSALLLMSAGILLLPIGIRRAIRPAA